MTLKALGCRNGRGDLVGLASSLCSGWRQWVSRCRPTVSTDHVTCGTARPFHGNLTGKAPRGKTPRCPEVTTQASTPQQIVHQSPRGFLFRQEPEVIHVDNPKTRSRIRLSSPEEAGLIDNSRGGPHEGSIHPADLVLMTSAAGEMRAGEIGRIGNQSLVGTCLLREILSAQVALRTAQSMIPDHPPDFLVAGKTRGRSEGRGTKAENTEPYNQTGDGCGSHGAPSRTLATFS